MKHTAELQAWRLSPFLVALDGFEQNKMLRGVGCITTTGGRFQGPFMGLVSAHHALRFYAELLACL